MTSRDVFERFNELKTGNVNIDLIGYIKTKNYKEIEFYLHHKFKEKRVGGEWFKLDQQDINDIGNEYDLIMTV